MPDVKPSLDGFLHLDAITIDVWHLAQQAMQGKAEAGLHAVQSGQSQNGGKLEDIWDPGVAFGIRKPCYRFIQGSLLHCRIEDGSPLQDTNRDCTR